MARSRAADRFDQLRPKHFQKEEVMERKRWQFLGHMIFACLLFIKTAWVVRDVDEGGQKVRTAVVQ